MTDSVVDDIIKQMVNQYPTGKTIDEIEFAIRQTDKMWHLGVSRFREMLKHMLNVLNMDSSPEPDIMLTVSVNNSRVRINDINRISSFCKNNAILAEDPSNTFENKEKHKVIDLPYQLRLRYSSETPIKDPVERSALVEQLLDTTNHKKTYRFAKRYSLPVATIGKGKINLDFTVVKQGTSNTFSNARLVGVSSSRTPELYEVELELTGFTQTELNKPQVKDKLKSILDPLLRFYHGGLTISNDDRLITNINSYVQLCKTLFSQLPNVKPVNNLSQKSMTELAPYYIAANISTLDRTVLKSGKMLKDSGYYVTDKADGTRCLLYINSNMECFLIIKETQTLLKDSKDYITGKAITVLDNEPTTLFRMIDTGIKINPITYYEKVIVDGKPKNELKTMDVKNSVLDGEFLKNNLDFHYKIFDLLIHNEKSVINTTFNDRLKTFKNISDTQNSKFQITAKEFTPYDGNLEKMKSYINDSLHITRSDSGDIIDIKIKGSGFVYDLDGLVFQPKDGDSSYYPEPGLKTKTWLSVYKWKPLHHLTIDLKLDYIAKGNAKVPIVVMHKLVMEDISTIKKQINYAKFDASSVRGKDYVNSEFPCYANLDENNVPRTLDGEPITKGVIVECRLSFDNSAPHWVPVRIRHDKSRPNSYKVYQSTMLTLTVEPITLNNLTEPLGGFGGHSSLNVTKLNRQISNNHIIATGMQTKGKKLSILDLASGNAKSAGAWKELVKRGKNVEIMGIDINDVTKAYSYLSSDNSFNINKKTGKQYIENYVFKLGDYTKPLHTEPNLIELVKAERFDIVSCVFGIYYSMRSEKEFRIFLANVTRNLKLDGVFIGSYMNKRKVLDLYNSQKYKTMNNNVVEGKIDDKTIWRIEKTFETSSVFKDNSIIVDFLGLYEKNVEYLLDLEEVQSILLEYGLVLESPVGFSNMLLNEQEKSKYDAMSTAEQQWFYLHDNFIIRKKHTPKIYSELFDGNPVKASTALTSTSTSTLKSTVKVKQPTAKVTVNVKQPTAKVTVKVKQPTAKIQPKIKLIKSTIHEDD